MESNGWPEPEQVVQPLLDSILLFVNDSGLVLPFVGFIECFQELLVALTEPVFSLGEEHVRNGLHMAWVAIRLGFGVLKGLCNWVVGNAYGSLPGRFRGAARRRVPQEEP